MILKFYARGDLLVTVPGTVPAVGQPLPRVGRDPVSRDAIPPATKDAFEIDSDSDAGRRILKIARRESSLWPADKATAEACGLAFVELEFQGGSWVPKAAPSSKAATSKGSE